MPTPSPLVSSPVMRRSRLPAAARRVVCRWTSATFGLWSNPRLAAAVAQVVLDAATAASAVTAVGAASGVPLGARACVNGEVSTTPDQPARVAGRLLVATPTIDDGVFFRTVILVLQHDGTGAQGVVLNRPLEAPVGSVLPEWQPLASAPGRVFHGGPVELDTAIGLARVPAQGSLPDGIQRLFGPIAVLDLDSQPDRLGADLLRVRVFAGYAGWSPGQLDTEIESGSWFVVDREAEDVFTEAPGDLWSQVLRRQPAPLSWLATMPADPSAN